MVCIKAGLKQAGINYKLPNNPQSTRNLNILAKFQNCSTINYLGRKFESFIICSYLFLRKGRFSMNIDRENQNWKHTLLIFYLLLTECP